MKQTLTHGGAAPGVVPALSTAPVRRFFGRLLHALMAQQEARARREIRTYLGRLGMRDGQETVEIDRR